MATFFGRRRPQNNGGQPMPEQTRQVRPPIGTGIDKLAKPDERLTAEWALSGKQTIITDKEVAEAEATLQKYRQGKANLEARVIEDEQWWKLRHWEVIRRKQTATQLASPEPASGWLFNSIINKHADAMDNIPEPIVLPRERSDEQSAKTLTSVLPVIMEHNHFDETYSINWLEKLKHGTAVYGVFWDTQLENGLGDISVQRIDLLNVFWEPGIEDIQDSKNVFISSLCDTEWLTQEYPELKNKAHGGGRVSTSAQYIYDDTVDNSEKTEVVDWYYKVRGNDGRTVLHYVKFACGHCLYASENDEHYQYEGYYADGMYPIVFDALYPEKGTPCGYGYVAICKDPQLYIDKLSANILESSMMATKRRFFVGPNLGVNEEEFLDWAKPLVHCETAITENNLREITLDEMPSIYYSVLQMKVEEMKDTSSNRDVNSGGAPGSGVSAASAIAALQEAGNKVSRSMISASYRAYTRIVEMCIERIRQFYDEQRSFRITGQAPGEYEFVQMGNQQIVDQPVGRDSMGEMLYRRPIFDLKVKAQKKNPFSRMEENERAKELFQLGFFNPEAAQQAMGALEMMDFEGIDKVKEYIGQGQTMLNLLKQMQQQLAMLTGGMMAAQQQQAGPKPQEPGQGEVKSGNTQTGEIMESRTPKTAYMQQLAANSKPSLEGNAG